MKKKVGEWEQKAGCGSREQAKDKGQRAGTEQRAEGKGQEQSKGHRCLSLSKAVSFLPEPTDGDGFGRLNHRGALVTGRLPVTPPQKNK